MPDLTPLHAINALPPLREDDDPTTWTCPVCGPIPPLPLPNGRVIRRSCACERAARKAERERRERQETMRRMAERTYGGWLYPDQKWFERRLISCSFEQLNLQAQPRKEDRAPLAFAVQKARAFVENPQGTFLLYGEAGLGKTHILASICNALRERGISSLFTSSPKFFAAFYDRMEHEGNEWDLVEQAVLTPFFVCDDLGKSTPKPFRQETMFLIIDERVKAGRPIGITTNTMERLSTSIGDQAYSRLQVGLLSIKLTGQDYRARLTIKEEAHR